MNDYSKRKACEQLSVMVVFLVVFVLSVVLPAGAQSEGGEDTENSSFTIPELVITARGYARPVSRTPGGIGVIAEPLFVQQPVASVSNAIGSVPGVNKSSDSAWGSDINIRGRSRSSVVLLIDGARVNTATDLNAQYGLVDPADVHRVEILKGPISSLYGSGTIGGVVNVITKSGRFASQPELKGELLTGLSANPDGANSYASLAFNSPDYYSYVSQSYRNLNSYESGDGNLVRNSQYDDRQSKMRIGWSINDEHVTEAQFQYFEGHEIGIPGTGTAPLPNAADVTYPDVRRGLAQVTHTYTPSYGWLTESRLNLFYQYIHRHVRIDNLPEASPLLQAAPKADHQTGGLRWQNVITAGSHVVVAGVDAWERQVDSTRVRYLRSGASIFERPLPESTFRSSGVFAEDSYDVNDWLTLSAGARFDFIQVENDATEAFEERDEDDASWNAHVGATIVPEDDVSITVIGSRGFRSPSIEERYQFLQLGSGVTKLGDPDLDPEESLFFETGLHYSVDTAKLSVSGYVNMLDDLVAEQRVDEETIISANIAEARIWGFEAEARWMVVPGAETYALLSYVNGEDTGTDDDLSGIPPLQGLAGVRVSNSNGLWGLGEFEFAARQSDVPEGEEETSSWETVRVQIGYDFDLGVTKNSIVATVDNAFDEEYRDHLSTSRGIVLSEPGRSFSLTYALRY